MSKFWEKLQNPFVLVGQGFFAGAILFFATQHDSGEARAASAVEAPSIAGAAAAR